MTMSSNMNHFEPEERLLTFVSVSCPSPLLTTGVPSSAEQSSGRCTVIEPPDIVIHNVVPIVTSCARDHETRFFGSSQMSNLQGLLHDSLLATGHVECCTIIGRKDGAIKASSAGYEPTGEQVEALMSAFLETGSAQEHGVHFNGATYKCVRADKHSIYAKKEGSGFVTVRTGSLIVFGSYSSSMFPSVCVEAVERLGEYFREKGK